MNNQQNQKMKTMLLEMLAWFHAFCTWNGLRYYILGGTMLGAVRHGGFIPWDDDIDVGMPRQDYIRLSRLMEEIPHPRYILETPHSENGDYFYCNTKLYDTQTTLIENTRCRIRRGIFLDIFPLDGAGDTREAALACFMPIKRRRNLLLTLTAGIREGRSAYKNLAAAVMGLVPEGIVNRKKLLQGIDLRAQEQSFDTSAWVGNLMGCWMERELMPRSAFGEPTAYTFEGLTVFGPEDPETYLTTLYGNWRQLPPEDKRRSHHDFLLLDLENGYLRLR